MAKSLPAVPGRKKGLGGIVLDMRGVTEPFSCAVAL
jgi:hypothetical protein